ncbi:hypothetical protein DFA_09758 [Cavenderia fasciculata]|uniref:FHA domain-containing protein n=1 Tax=Cavenderia fasciculata TaxID=261658 RepID=F4Q8I6_CACFS|nr:uncharacterized protein DFA_09758 [Cavenderia fasciculata]EGG16086.1 hypothetical protein DFA_09758 [Cavenderia fasciculata]|eukprot:XP_004352411.1 hypothetical protein DFA_09758 [Cavenderia fasciculata]
MNILNLSNLLLLQIILKIDDNGDIRIRAINDKGSVGQQFNGTAIRLNHNAFKDIMDNSISDQHVLLSREDNNDGYVNWIHNRVTAHNRVDKSTRRSCISTISRPSNHRRACPTSSITSQTKAEGLPTNGNPTSSTFKKTGLAGGFEIQREAF